jgi:hypothetical protein
MGRSHKDEPDDQPRNAADAQDRDDRVIEDDEPELRDCHRAILGLLLRGALLAYEVQRRPVQVKVHVGVEHESSWPSVP